MYIKTSRIVRCACCGKQVVWNRNPSRYDELVTKGEGGKSSIHPDEIFCGYCAIDLDENGMFSEERALEGSN